MKIKTRPIILLLPIAIFVGSCSNDSALSKKAILELTGDSLSLAVDYLFEEIPNRYTTKSEVLVKYYKFVDSLYNVTDEYFHIKKQLEEYHSKNPNKDVTFLKDAEVLSNEYIANSVLNSYKYWDKPWNRHLTEKQFHDYVLPYKICDEEIEDWRTLFQNKYGYVLDSLVQSGDSITAEIFCTALVEELKKHQVNIFTANIYSTTIRPSTLNIMDCGTCKDYCDYVNLVFRSFGLPVATDGLFGWHNWNALIAKDRTIDFYVEATPDDLHLKEWLDVVGWHNLPKIYRETYHPNMQSLAITHGEELVPPFFLNPYMIDVTKEYYNGFEYQFLPKKDLPDKQYGYLKVWNNRFIFVDWAKRGNGNKFCFHNISDSVVYFPSFYVNDAINRPADYPFVITADSIIKFEPKTDAKISMTLWRKYFIRRDHNKYLKAMVEGRFVGANKPDFSDGELICEIIKEPQMRWNELKVSTKKAYRYIRYEAPRWSYGNVGEIEFYSSNSAEPLNGIVIGTDTPDSEETSREKAFDGDVLTYFNALLPHDAWVGMDFGKPIKINRIRFISRNDDNFVQKDQEYELMYADLNGWRSMGIKFANADSLVYDNVPSGAIYLLRNRTKGHEERIFSYENGKQVWW